MSDGNLGPTETVVEVPITPKELTERIHVYIMPVVNNVVALCMTAFIGVSTWRITFRILLYDQYWAFVYMPLVFVGGMFASFAIKSILLSLLMTIMPLRYLQRNSQHYSLFKSRVFPLIPLPQVVIQIPVYTECFDTVIRPTLGYAEAAIAHYESCGGIGKVMVCDDGLAKMLSVERNKRIKYYTEHNIAYVARPMQNRQGKFKKASNLNFCTSLATTDRLSRAAWVAEKGGDLDINDDALILLLDSDTRIPETCIIDMVPEILEGGDKIGYLQHSMRAFSDQNKSLWQKMIFHSTNRIYKNIAVGTALGDIAPIVGHNVLLKWSCLRNVARQQNQNSQYLHVWSEEKVSEDFDIFLRLAAGDIHGRYVVYCGEGFEEGISLSYVDELKKLTKFAFGACELLFLPCNQWFKRGPISPTIIQFIQSKHIPFHCKLSTLYYLSTYIAFAAAFYFVLLESVLTLVNPMWWDRYLLRTFDVMLSCLVVFLGVPTLTNFVFKWRVTGRPPFVSTVYSFGLGIIHGLFLVSCMFPITLTTLCYFGDTDISWGATSKKSVPTKRQIMRELRWCYFIIGPLTVGYLVAAVLRGMTYYYSWGMLFYGLCHLVVPLIL